MGYPKYGSSVRITVRPLWDDTVLYEGQLVVSSSPQSRKTLASVISNINSWFESALRVSLLTQGNNALTDDDIYQLAVARGFIQPGQRSYVSPTVYPELFYVDSASGKTKGHYIQLGSDYVYCTCPGYVNRGYCWASNEVKSGRKLGDKWASTRERFYEYRRRDYPNLP